ncbi:Hypothetical_protein [Hexamita inflata]|uniref:Hypothetical_protein n=1 Tax=Hexamita inflata TaxID=28002 RepID=A0AA86V0W7_9EUKA|nr:Hypothetical protein HINF_LOCUS59567 [Hexamita inflata]
MRSTSKPLKTPPQHLDNIIGDVFTSTNNTSEFQLCDQVMLLLRNKIVSNIHSTTQLILKINLLDRRVHQQIALNLHTINQNYFVLVNQVLNNDNEENGDTESQKDLHQQ